VHGAAKVIAEFEFLVVNPNGGVYIKVLAVLALEIKNPVVSKDSKPG
jgi:hypothetical protein